VGALSSSDGDEEGNGAGRVDATVAGGAPPLPLLLPVAGRPRPLSLPGVRARSYAWWGLAEPSRSLGI
jgi:hypothetical protein